MERTGLSPAKAGSIDYRKLDYNSGENESHTSQVVLDQYRYHQMPQTHTRPPAGAIGYLKSAFRSDTPPRSVRYPRTIQNLKNMSNTSKVPDALN